MADFELFNGTNLEEPDSDHRIAMNKPSLAGAFFVRWDNFKNLIRSFTVSKDTDQSISGNKTFTGIVNVQAPTSDNNPVTLKYFNDNAGGGGGTLTFDTSFELTAYLTNPDREAGQLATCLDLGYEDVILRLSNDTTKWEGIEATVYATQEQAIEGIETAVVMNPLRSAQQWVYNVLTRTFEELTTASKTIIGAINELKTNVIKLESDETPAPIADTDNVRFKSATGYYVRTLLAIKNYVKLGLKASEVVNDSTIVLSPTVKAAFDNADCVAVTSLQDTDMIPFGRANGAVSENKMIPAIDAKSYFAPSPVLFNVTTTSELVTILGAPTCPYSVTINLLQEVEFPAILNTYALNILFVGRKITVSGDVAVNGMRPGAGVISFDVILLITDRAIITVSCFDFMSSLDMRFKDILSNWVDTQYNLKLARGVDSMVSWGANNLISTKLSNDSNQLFIDNDYYVVTDTCGVTFVSDETGLSAALAAEKETMQICATEDITISSLSNVFAGNVWITGRKITISSGFSLLNSTSARAVTRLVFDAAVNLTGDSGDGTCIIGATAGIWHLTFRDLTSAKPIKIFASVGAEIHITTRKQLTGAAGSSGTYSLSSDYSLDIIDDDIIVNTNIVIGATYAGPYTIADVPNNYIVDSIEITDVTLTSFSLIPKFETSTATYTSIADSQQKVTDKSIYIYNNKPIQTGLGLINNTKTLSVYVLNTYGVNRRLVLSDYSGGWTNSTVNVKVVLKENK